MPNTHVILTKKKRKRTSDSKSNAQHTKQWKQRNNMSYISDMQILILHHSLRHSIHHDDYSLNSTLHNPPPACRLVQNLSNLYNQHCFDLSIKMYLQILSLLIQSKYDGQHFLTGLEEMHSGN